MLLRFGNADLSQNISKNYKKCLTDAKTYDILNKLLQKANNDQYLDK